MDEFWRACMNMMMGSGGVLMMLVMVLFWVALLAVLVLGIRWLWRHESGSRSDADPLRTLEQRFASGEIDREEFEERRRLLSRSSGCAPTAQGSPRARSCGG